MGVYGLDPLARGLVLTLLEAHQSVNGTCGQCGTTWPCQAPGVKAAVEIFRRPDASPLPSSTPMPIPPDAIKAVTHNGVGQAVRGKSVGVRAASVEARVLHVIGDGVRGHSWAGSTGGPSRLVTGRLIITDRQRHEQVLAQAHTYSR